MAIDPSPGTSTGGGSQSDSPGGGSHYWTSDVDGDAVGQTGPWDVGNQNRFIVYVKLVSGVWLDAELVVEASVDNSVWTTLSTIAGVGKDSIVDIEEYAYVRIRVSSADTGGSGLLLAYRGYAWLRPFEFGGAGDPGSVPDPVSEVGAFLGDDGSWVLPGSGGLGDVVGPASSTDSGFARWDGTTGKLLQDTGSGSYMTDNGDATFRDIVGTGSVSLGSGAEITMSGPPSGNLRIDASIQLQVDTINEQTSDTGVTIENVLIKDGTVQDSMGIVDSGDATKKALLDSSQLTTSTTRTYTFPDKDMTFGDGDVVGPSGATDNAIVRFDTTTGKLVQDSSVTITDGINPVISGRDNLGTVTLQSGTETVGSGKTTTVKGGDGATNGGGLLLTGGTPSDGNGGDVVVSASVPVGTNKDGADVRLAATAASGSGTDGDVTLTNPAGSRTLTQMQADAVILAADTIKLATIETSATADQSDAEIETAYNNQVDVVTQVEAEAGTDTNVHRWTPERVAQAIAALGGGGGGMTPTASKTSGYTAVVGDLVICDTSSGAFIVTFPSGASNGDQVGVYLASSGQNVLIMAAAFGDTVDTDMAFIHVSHTLGVFTYDSGSSTWRMTSQYGATSKVRRQFQARISATQDYSTAPMQVEWDVEDTKDDDCYTHSTSTNPEQITLERTGIYRVSYSLGFDGSYNDRTIHRGGLYLGGTLVPGSYDMDYMRYSSYGDFSSVGKTMLIDATANDILTVRSDLKRSSYGWNVTTTALIDTFVDSCHVSIEYLGQDYI